MNSVTRSGVIAPPNPRPRVKIAIVVLAIMATYSFAGIWMWAFPPGSNAGWRGTIYKGEFMITGMDDGWGHVGLLKGDQIMAINGIPIKDHPEMIGAESRMAPGSPFSMTVRRGDLILTYNWTTAANQRGSFPLGRLGPIFFWICGVLVFLLKPEDYTAYLLALTLGTFSGLLGGGFRSDVAPSIFTVLVSMARILGLFSLPLLVHLFLYFPQKSKWLEKWPSLALWLYVPTLLFILPGFGLNRLPLAWSTPLIRLSVSQWLQNHGYVILGFVTFTGYLCLALVCLWTSYRCADAVGRRKLRFILIGSVLGLGTLIGIIVIESLGFQERWGAAWGILQQGSLYTIPLIPVSFAYAIIRHKVIPVSLIIRRGGRYLLVSKGSIILLLGFTGLAVMMLLGVIFRNSQPSMLTVGLVSAGEALGAWQLANWLHEKYLAPRIDRRFFRQSYDAHKIAAEFSDRIRSITSISELTESLAQLVCQVLQTENAAVLLRNTSTGEYEVSHFAEYTAAIEKLVRPEVSARLSGESAVVKTLTEREDSLELDESGTGFSLQVGGAQPSPEELEAFRELSTALLMPIRTKSGMPGILSVGPRLGDLPFSGEDKSLLKSIASSASLAIENVKLMEEMISEAQRTKLLEAENEQRAKELEEARQLQLSMLPRRLPNIPGLEVAAFMKTATEVGGDYYDFHVEGETLTIAIGDATGHGLKAGTMVTATKGLFNHLAPRSGLVDALNHTSAALKQLNLRSLFMALTLVRVRERRLECSVAGMPPILIFRTDAGKVEEVPLRGLPLGGVANFGYRQTETLLNKGDVVLMQSDGLPERFNAASEMFGYERVSEFLVANSDLPLDALLTRLVGLSEEWAGGIPAADDMTFVAIRAV